MHELTTEALSQSVLFCTVFHYCLSFYLTYVIYLYYYRVTEYMFIVSSGSKQLPLKVNWIWLTRASPSLPLKTFIIL